MEQLKCNKCGRENLTLDDFPWKNKAKGKKTKACKECTVKTSMKHYISNKERYIAASAKRSKEQRLIISEKLYGFLTGKECKDCGTTDIRVFEFDHLDPSLKQFNIGNAANQGVSWERILNEIEKCEIICANCHRIRTMNTYNWVKLKFLNVS